MHGYQARPIKKCKRAIRSGHEKSSSVAAHVVHLHYGFDQYTVCAVGGSICKWTKCPKIPCTLTDCDPDFSGTIHMAAIFFKKHAASYLNLDGHAWGCLSHGGLDSCTGWGNSEGRHDDCFNE
jgi:hypothetical protein